MPFLTSSSYIILFFGILLTAIFISVWWKCYAKSSCSLRQNLVWERSVRVFSTVQYIGVFKSTILWWGNFLPCLVIRSKHDSWVKDHQKSRLKALPRNYLQSLLPWLGCAQLVPVVWLLHFSKSHAWNYKSIFLFWAINGQGRDITPVWFWPWGAWCRTSN